MNRARAVLAGLVMVAGVLAPSVAQAAPWTPTISEYASGSGSSGPVGIAAGADGNVWFTDDGGNDAVVRMTPSGTVTRFTAGLSQDKDVADITPGPGGMWFTETGGNKIGRIAANGTITEFPGGSRNKPIGITAGPDGKLWYTAQGGHGAIGRISTTGAITEFTTGLTRDAGVNDITLGPDGNLWFTETDGRIGRITPQGVITEFSSGLLRSPQQIVAGPDGNLWFTETGLLTLVPAIGRITPQGVVTEFTSGFGLLGNAPEGIAAGADGFIYFTDSGANEIGRLNPTTGAITRFSAGISNGAGLRAIASGPDGALWFAERSTRKLGRLTVAPTAGGSTSSDVVDTLATITGTVTPNSQATDVWLEWGTTTSYGSSTAPVSVPAGGTAQTFDEILTGLSANTTYHVRVVATNATGTTNGPDRTFTTTLPGAPSATSHAATLVTATTVSLNATINPQGDATTFHFDVGTTPSLGTQVPVSDVSAGSDRLDHAFSQPLTGLEPNTTYYARAVATSGFGTTLGEIVSFTTAAPLPGATTGGIDAVTEESAMLLGDIDPFNSATAFRFDWGPTASYGQSSPALDTLVGSDNTTHAVSRTIFGLDPLTTYHYRLVATSNVGSVAGTDATFTTLAAAPAVTTGVPASVTSSGAALSGTVSGRNSTARAWFEWGPTTAYGTTTDATDVPADLETHDVARTLTDLEPGTTYHARLVASGAAGTTYGPDRTFTTAGAALRATPPQDPVALAEPELARTATATATAARGTVRFRAPGSDAYVDLPADGAIPSGSLVDTRSGTLVLKTALDASGATQTARFRGTVVRISLSRATPGLVDVYVQGDVGRCPTGRGARTAAARRPVKLWGKDNNGRYRTHGRNSVATVRGTEWSTTETCAGTRTLVVKGAVSVYDRRAGRRVLVTAGHQYLAKATR